MRGRGAGGAHVALLEPADVDVEVPCLRESVAAHEERALVVQRAGVAGADGEGSRVAPVRLGEVVKVVLVEQAEVCEGVAGRLFVAAHGEDGLVHSLSDEVLSAVVLEPADVVGSFPRRWLRLKGSVVMLAGLFKISFSMIEGAEIRKCPHM